MRELVLPTLSDIVSKVQGELNGCSDIAEVYLSIGPHVSRSPIALAPSTTRYLRIPELRRSISWHGDGDA